MEDQTPNALVGTYFTCKGFCSPLRLFSVVTRIVLRSSAEALALLCYCVIALVALCFISSYDAGDDLVDDIERRRHDAVTIDKLLRPYFLLVMEQASVNQYGTNIKTR